jgi:hypothetical protein
MFMNFNKNNLIMVESTQMGNSLQFLLWRRRKVGKSAYINLMLEKENTCVFMLSVTYCYAYVNILMVIFPQHMYDMVYFFMPARSLQNAKVQRKHVGNLYIVVFWIWILNYGLHLPGLVDVRIIINSETGCYGKDNKPDYFFQSVQGHKKISLQIHLHLCGPAYLLAVHTG